MIPAFSSFKLTTTAFRFERIAPSVAAQGRAVDHLRPGARDYAGNDRQSDCRHNDNFRQKLDLADSLHSDRQYCEHEASAEG